MSSYLGLCDDLVHMIACFAVILAITTTRAEVDGNTSPSTMARTGPTKKYSVMLDAGSTGTRVHIFEFSIGTNNEITLEKETVKKIIGGLSGYAKDPSRVSNSLQPLLDLAKRTVPSHQRKSTPIALLATAGLRLLNRDAQTRILISAHQTLNNSDFLCGAFAVGLMHGTYEGFCCWLTVSFALGKHLSSDNRVAILDVGGASSQVAFIPRYKETLANAKHLHVFYLPGRKEQQMYAHSYYGGLMFSRAEILKMGKTGPGSKQTLAVKHACISENVTDLIWMYMDTMYDITPIGPLGFGTCYQVVKKRLEDMDIFAPRELLTADLYLSSFYFHRARITGLIERDVTSKDIFVSDFRVKAENECRKCPAKEKEFLCLELTYLYSILVDGLKVNPDKVVHVVSKVGKGKLEMSWALGAALSSLNLS